MVAGTNMFVEQAGNGLGISYLTALAGGAGTGSGGAGTGIGGEGTGTGGAGTGSGGAGTPTQPLTNSIPWNTRDDLLGQLYPVSLNGTRFPPAAWSNLLNSYAVWVSPGVGYPADAGINFSFTYKINFDRTALYSLSCSADNEMTVYIDNVFALASVGPRSAPRANFQITSGIHYLKIIAINYGVSQELWINNPGAWAVLIDYA